MLQQRGHLIGNRPYRDGHGGIAMPAADDGAGINRDHVPGGQRGIVARDAMHDLVVYRCADRCRISVIALE